MKGIAFNTWPYSGFPAWVPSYPLDDVINRLSSFGYDAIEIGCASPHAWPDYLSKERRQEISTLLKQRNLKVAAMLPAPGGGPGMNPSSPLREEREFTINHYKEVVRLAHEWECSTVMWIAGWVVHGTSQQDAWNYSLEGLGDVANYAKELGVTMVVEPTPADSNLIETADDALILSEQTGASNVKVMFDTFHALYRNEVASDYVYRMADKLHHVHIADSDRLPPGQGRCDFPAVLKALKDINYDGYLSMEVGFHTRQAEPDWYARTSIEYLKAELKKLD
ncbi:sugar phosphate isomerase/epimerase family protein [Domibacillus sp. DTU_2020_1001157_1_SI_ALB_TIR_016]|uniref:sugar phosphate isomerase/epimerase family protein n=1 Tax=Domibacillus sp. DTU_2020_1001157_1_SI_ALB_TIR_016 TaxID=3077789 RepID=UPI0028E3A082|nr:sugar phosphate isomerase/epimerase family protein [Domibacillus sp. DTU_2020_1001157_1_SI_ALB_TIR_016]WNS79602.1 sugar phosphate isomerase/epimerase family protein [Domibacillus sp. DTU_2020_1001157_1_SI_ALB_TIR_016]